MRFQLGLLPLLCSIVLASSCASPWLKDDRKLSELSDEERTTFFLEQRIGLEEYTRTQTIAKLAASYRAGPQKPEKCREISKFASVYNARADEMLKGKANFSAVHVRDCSLSVSKVAICYQSIRTALNEACKGDPCGETFDYDRCKQIETKPKEEFPACKAIADTCYEIP